MAFTTNIPYLIFCITLALMTEPKMQTHAWPAKNNVHAAMVSSLKTVVDECRQQTGATENDFESMVRKEPAVSMEAKCMRACLMKKFNVMDENGKFNREVVLEIAREHVNASNKAKMRIATEIVDICQDLVVSENHCEAAEQYSKCANDKYATARAFNDFD